MNTDEKGDTDGKIRFAKHLNYPCSSVNIRVHHLQTLRSRGDHHSAARSRKCIVDVKACECRGSGNRVVDLENHRRRIDVARAVSCDADRNRGQPGIARRGDGRNLVIGGHCRLEHNGILRVREYRRRHSKDKHNQDAQLFHRFPHMDKLIFVVLFVRVGEEKYSLITSVSDATDFFNNPSRVELLEG